MKYVCEGYHTKLLLKAVSNKDAAILVAAGPSLNKNIQMLKKAKNRLFILAVDTAVKPLIKAGIKPRMRLLPLMQKKPGFNKD